MQRKFCELQMESKEDKGTQNYCCIANLSWGVVVSCPYNESQIFAIKEGKDYKFKIKIPSADKKSDEICKEFNITSNLENELIRRINNSI